MRKKSALSSIKSRTWAKRRRYTQKLQHQSDVDESDKSGTQDVDESYKSVTQDVDESDKSVTQDASSLVCDICYKVFTSAAQLEKHVGKAHSGSSYVCICSWSHSDIGTLREHKQSCGQHARMMAERRRHRCDECNLAYTRADSLRKHVVRKHPNRSVDSFHHSMKKENYVDRRMKDENGAAAFPNCGETAAATDEVDEEPFPDEACTEEEAGMEETKAPVKWEWANQLELDVAGGLLGDVTEACVELERQGREVFVMVRDRDQLLYMESAGVSGFLRNNTSVVQHFLNHDCLDAERRTKDVNLDINVVVIKFKSGAGKLHSDHVNPLMNCTDKTLVTEVDAVRANSCNIDKDHNESDPEPYMLDNALGIGADNMDTLSESNDISMEIHDDSLSEGQDITIYVEPNDISADSANKNETFNISVQLDKSVVEEYIAGKNTDLNKPNDSKSRKTLVDTEKLSGQENTDLNKPNDSKRGKPLVDMEKLSEQEKSKMRERMKLYKLWLKIHCKMEGINDTTKTDEDTVRPKSDPDENNLVTFPCVKCGSCFLIERHLKSHQLRHQNCDKEQNRMDVSSRRFLEENVTYSDENGTEVTRTFQSVLDSQTSAPFQCLICRSVYPTIWKLFNHINTHSQKMLFTCAMCERRYRSAATLKDHVKRHYQRPYDCDQCRMFFVTEEDLQEHQQNKCLQSLQSRLLSVQTHVTGDGTLLSCEHCSFTTENRSMMLAHQQKHEKPADQRFHKCLICDRQLKTMSSLANHLATVHWDGKWYTCDLCGKSFKQRCTHRKHMKSHQEQMMEKKYKCEVCDKGFTEKDYLRKHMQRHTGEKPYVCDICGETFGRTMYLKNHRHKHTGETPYVCKKEGCGKGFRSPQNLKQHMRTHEKVGSYICDICGRTFKQRGQLNHHRKNHIIEWRWPCTYCEEKFKSCYTYKRHLAMTHPEKKDEIEKTTNIRLHKCTICQKMYHEKEDLNRHMDMHQGIKPFHCKYCNKSFSNKSNLTTHEQRHAGVKKLKCTSCYKTFIHEKNLIAHMEKHKDDVRQEYEAVMDSVKADEISTIVTGDHVDTDLYGRLVVDQLSQFPL